MSQKMIRKLSRGVNIVGGIAKNREKCFLSLYVNTKLQIDIKQEK